ncbi:uncharacterized protein LOC110875400 [Helianthus annuus]|uniref:uncharacterized protein LOC110875400 n=1 Tax=Helianthus annuus TaxID=4232 RepID=UPI000B90705E|nr:uncharacterized protein LOC110875400 [Helianthus annuus]
MEISSIYFGKKLLEGQCPAWKFVSQSTPQRQRKRPNYLLEGESDVDGGGVKTRRKIVNNEPAQLKTVTGGVNEGVSAATNKSQSLSGDQFSLTSMLDHLKPTVSELCNILKFSEDVKIIVDRFLEYVLENFTVGKEHTSLLQALMISLCWIGSSLAKNKIDRSESFALAKKHFEFSCTEEETESVYNKLKLVKDKYLNHVLPYVESAEVAKPAVKEENAEDSIILPAALHANEDHNVSFCSDSGNPVCAAISQDKTPSVHEIKSEPLQLEQLPDSGIQDEEINVCNLQPSGASQLDQIIPDDEPDFPSSTDPTVAENPSDTLPPSEPLLEPTVEDNVTKFYQELKQRLKADCEKEIDEVVAQIRLKYEAKHQEADAAYNSKKMELVTNIHRVPMNKGLADAFRSKCQDLTPSMHPVSQVTPTTPTTSRPPPPPGFNMSKLLALHSEEDDPDYMVEEDNPMEDVQLDDDPDYIVEEDNSVEDVEMDMSHVKAFVDHGIEEVDEHIDQHNDDLQDDTNVDIDNFDSHSENDDGDFTVLKKVAKRIRKQKRKSPSTDSYNPFYIGQLIEDKEKLHEMVKNYALTSRREVFIAKNEPLRYRVVCMGTNPTLIGVECLQGQSSHTSTGQSKKPKKLCKRKTKPTCPWAIHISRRTILDSWCVKTICHQHQCLQTIEPGLYTMSSIAKEIEPIIESNPEIPLRALQDVIQKKHQVQVSLSKVFRAKMIVTKKLVGDYRDQYGMLTTYCEELLRANPGSTIKIDVEPSSNPSSNTRQFRRVYICYAAMKRGFKICGREILGLDGCFMNGQGQYPGQILSAVGVDGNNCIYPFASALVEAETYESWSWFLDSLQNDLDLTCNSNFTFISDRQNGVIPAMKRVFPNAEHRYCLRHIHENIKKQWCGDVFKNLLWKAASVTTLAYFNNAMQDIRDKDPTLHDWLLQMPPQTWSRSHFTSSAQCDILLNNICEEFNEQLIGATDKPVITCLEYIREYMTRRIVNVKKA